jgi:3-hydroxyisobutyrate dehydrogenase
MADDGTVAVLGTGIMGAPMARNAARAGLRVRAWNRSPERVRALAADGVEVAGSPAEAASGAGVVVTMLADGDAVEAVAREALAAAAGAVWAQTSTVGVVAVRRLAALAAEHGVPFVDAPVLGTKAPAEAGALTVLAAGPRDARERCAPFFSAIAQKVVELEEAGEGQRLKLVLNSWVVALVEAVGEALALARALGIPGERFLETIAGGPLDSAYAQTKGAAMLAGELAPSFTLMLARKDCGLVLEAASEAGLELPLARGVAEGFDRAIAAGHGGEDMAATYAGLVAGAR